MNKKIIIAASSIFALMLILTAVYVLVFYEFRDISSPVVTEVPAETTSRTTSRTTNLTTETSTASQVSEETDEETETTTQTEAIPDEEEWALFLVNKDNPLPPGYIDNVVLEPVYETFLMDARCAGAARDMLKAAENDGVKLIVISAYRSEEKQADNFDDYVERLIREGMTAEEALSVTTSQIAQPGESEHNAAIALDILSEDWYIENDDITEAFDLTPEFAWLSENSWKYGFIIRYEKGKSDITGFDYEPWHYRYVGVKRARDILDTGLSLDEYIALY